MFSKVSIDHLFVNLSLEKYSVVLEKVLNFGSKNLYEPCRVSVRLTLESHYLLDSNIVLKKKTITPTRIEAFIYLFIYSFILFVLFVCLFVFFFLPAHSPILRVSF